MRRLIIGLLTLIIIASLASATKTYDENIGSALISDILYDASLDTVLDMRKLKLTLDSLLVTYGFIDTLSSDSIFSDRAQIDTLSVDRIYSIGECIQVVINDTVDPTVGSWTSLQWDSTQSINSETFEWPVGADSTKIVINDSGVSMIGGHIVYDNVSGASKDSVSVATRILVNSAELNGSQFIARRFEFKSYGEGSLGFEVANCFSIGDTIEYQYHINIDGINFTTPGIFDNRLAVYLLIIRQK